MATIQSKPDPDTQGRHKKGCKCPWCLDPNPPKPIPPQGLDMVVVFPCCGAVTLGEHIDRCHDFNGRRKVRAEGSSSIT
jgi:hypothetical protein